MKKKWDFKQFALVASLLTILPKLSQELSLCDVAKKMSVDINAKVTFILSNV